MNHKPVAVITGASRGIGRAIAISLASEGFDIAAIARSTDSKGMEILNSEVKKRGSEFFPVGLDISCIISQTEVVSNILERYGRIDFLVNNAGVAPIKPDDLLEVTEESYNRVMNINLRGPFFFAQKIAKEMIWLNQQLSDYKPAIVFITSALANISAVNRAEYCISKAGLSSASRIFADRLSKENIHIYEVRPGIIQTDMTAIMMDKYNSYVKEGVVPQKRWGLPEDIGRAVASLARGDWDFSTGMIFEISGGLNIHRL